MKAHDHSVDAAFTLLMMNELRASKMDGWTVHLVDQFPELKTLKGLTFLGSFAWTSKAVKTKWIKKPFAYNIGGGWVTPSDIARDYLAVSHGDKRLRCTTKQWHEVVRIRRAAPLYAQPCSMKHALYLDMKSAYWQLLMLGGWDVEYLPRKYLSPRSDVYDFPVPQIKLARNCIVSMGLPSGVNVWIPEHGFQQLKPYKPNVNIILWSFIQDVLNGFADDMVERVGAVYVNTDGYIIDYSMLNEALAVADEWGLTVTVKNEGEATIRGAGDYDIGGHRSRRVRTIPRAYKRIDVVSKDWLKRRVKRFSSRILLDLKHEFVTRQALTET